MSVMLGTTISKQLMKRLLPIFDIWDKSATPMKEGVIYLSPLSTLGILKLIRLIQLEAKLVIHIEVTFLSCGGSGVTIDDAGVLTTTGAGELVTRAGGVTSLTGGVIAGAAGVTTGIEEATRGAGGVTGTVELTTGKVGVTSGTDGSVIGIRLLGAGACTIGSWQGTESSVGSPVPFYLILEAMLFRELNQQNNKNK
ncbi:unnamed protein product [Callosobruchus maculatus]|uniref:Uncharacterized protein n=1 Tax=Callosobruchus maculatus TaxID=64391 RepID=A0A653BMG4_CALMS|nr:unnamed protein product [Callosobruchus maculatus]